MKLAVFNYRKTAWSRYALRDDISKISIELNWKPTKEFYAGLRKTIEWYLNNEEWIEYVKVRNIS